VYPPIPAGLSRERHVARLSLKSQLCQESLYSTLTVLYCAFDEITTGLTREERARLFGGTAKEFYRFPELGEASSAVRACTSAPLSHE
jgi:hypothetical protein